MSSNFNPLLWFVCRHCRQAFPDTDKLKKHKIRKHFQECSIVKCIVFEERLLGKPWIPTDNFYPEAAAGALNENELEISPQKIDCICKCRNPSASVSVSVQTEELHSLPNPESQQKLQLKPSPVVVAKRLTQAELIPYISQTTKSHVTELQSKPNAIPRDRKNRNQSFDDLNLVPEIVSQAFADPSSDSVQDDDRPRILTSEKRRKLNPYVLVRRLTTAELNFCSNGSACRTAREPKSILNQMSRGAKRSSECFLNKSTGKKNKKILVDAVIEKNIATFSEVICGASDLDANKSTAKSKNSVEEPNNEEITFAHNEDALDSVSNSSELEVPTSPTSAFYSEDDRESLPEHPSPLVVELDSDDTGIPDLSEISNGQVQFGVTTTGLNSELNPIANNDFTIHLRPNYAAQEPDQVESGDEGSIRIISVASHAQYFKDPVQTETPSNASSAPRISKNQKQKQSPKKFTKGRKDLIHTFTGTSAVHSKSATDMRTRTSRRNRAHVNYSEDFICKNCSKQCDSAEELTEHEPMCSSSSVTSSYMTVEVTDDSVTVTENEVTSQSTAVLQSLSQTAASDAPVLYKIPKGVRIPAPLLSQLNAQAELRTKPASTKKKVSREAVFEENSDDGNGGSDCILESENYPESDSDSEKEKQTGKKKKGHQQLAKRKFKKSFESANFKSYPIQVPKNNNLLLLRWLKNYKQQQATMEERFRNVLRLDPDPVQGNFVPISPENPVTCKLCETKLERAFSLKNHIENCWIHNRVRHLYCTICETSFYRSSITLAAARLNFRSHTVDTHPEISDNWWSPVDQVLGSNEPEDSDPKGSHSQNNDPEVNDSQNHDPQVNDAQDSDLPLGKWLKKQKENRHNCIRLDPEPRPTATTLSLNEPFASPIKCKLCQQLLTSDILLRNHVKVCYQNNKNEHVYCVICKKAFTSNFDLQCHNRKKHGPNIKRSESLLFCNACEESFTTEADFTRHKQSLQAFVKSKMSKKKLARKSIEAAAAAANKNKTIESAAPSSESDTQAIIPDPDAEVVVDDWANTFSYVSELVKFYRQFQSPDGSKNIILLDPEPEPSDYRVISYGNPIKCQLCFRKLTSPPKLRNHVVDCWFKNRGRHRYCVPCEETFTRPKELLEHNRVEHPEKLRAAFKCKVCLQEYFDEALFEQHEEAHKDPKFLPFKCPLEDCDLSFKDERSFEKHLADHRKKIQCFRCRLCGKSYRLSEALSNHMRSHTGERPFKCQVESCGASFRSKVVLTQHNRMRHSAELGLSQDHLCSTCGKAFVTLSILNHHLYSRHVIKAKVHKCPYEGCSKSFSNKTQLAEHERDHTGEKPFQCDTCGQAFSKQWTFTKHKRSHEGTLNRAACHLCPRKFLGTWELKQHLAKVHEGAARVDDGSSSESD